MAPSRVIFHPEAAREIEVARDWYIERSAQAEEGFIAELNHAVDQVATAPLRWPRFKANTRRYVFRHYPYSLVYRPTGEIVRILAVAHDKRRAEYWIVRTEQAAE